MTIPLDKLYNFLDDIVDQDIIIYRWSPHGSKKLTDLTQLTTGTVLESIITPRVVCHDQEPLNYFLYSTEEILDAIVEKKLKLFPGWTGDQLKKYYLDNDYYLNYLQELLGTVVLYDRFLLLHSEKNSVHLDEYEKYGAIPVYYLCHGLISRDWFRYAKIDPALSKKRIVKDFLIYNRAWAGTREYRIKFSELIVNNNLHQHCLMNFSEVDSDIHYTDHKFTNCAFRPDRNDLEKYFLKNTASGNFSADYNQKDYCSCGIEVVLETLFDDSRNHLTEKIFRPIACGQPFILASTPYSLEYLKDYGFKTFGDFIDESYDSEIDPLKRLNKIILLMKEITALSNDKKNQLFLKMNSIASFNKQRFFSDDFKNLIIEEYKNNIEQGLIKLKKFKGTNFLTTMERRRSNNMPIFIDNQTYEFVLKLINS